MSLYWYFQPSDNAKLPETDESAIGWKRLQYVKFSSEVELEIGKRAAEHGEVVTPVVQDQ